MAYLGVHAFMNQNFAAQAGLLVGEHYRPLSGRSGRARSATSTLFLVDGMTFGTWAALIPSFQQKFSLSEVQLSLVLLGARSMRAASRTCHWRRRRWLCRFRALHGGRTLRWRLLDRPVWSRYAAVQRVANGARRGHCCAAPRLAHRCWSVSRPRDWALPISCRFFSARRAGRITTAPDRGSQP